MVNRRIGLLVATLAIVASACSSGGATAPESAPAVSEAPASEAAESPGGSAAAGACTVACRGTTSSSRAGPRMTSPNMKDTVEDGGGTFIEADANLSTEQQLTDVDNLLGRARTSLSSSPRTRR